LEKDKKVNGKMGKVEKEKGERQKGKEGRLSNPLLFPAPLDRNYT